MAEPHPCFWDVAEPHPCFSALAAEALYYKTTDARNIELNKIDKEKFNKYMGRELKMGYNKFAPSSRRLDVGAAKAYPLSNVWRSLLARLRQHVGDVISSSQHRWRWQAAAPIHNCRRRLRSDAEEPAGAEGKRAVQEGWRKEILNEQQ